MIITAARRNVTARAESLPGSFCHRWRRRGSTPSCTHLRPATRQHGVPAEPDRRAGVRSPFPRDPASRQSGAQQNPAGRRPEGAPTRLVTAVGCRDLLRAARWYSYSRPPSWWCRPTSGTGCPSATGLVNGSGASSRVPGVTNSPQPAPRPAPSPVTQAPQCPGRDATWLLVGGSPTTSRPRCSPCPRPHPSSAPGRRTGRVPRRVAGNRRELLWPLGCRPCGPCSLPSWAPRGPPIGDDPGKAAPGPSCEGIRWCGSLTPTGRSSGPSMAVSFNHQLRQGDATFRNLDQWFVIFGPGAQSGSASLTAGRRGW
jgi:hypothetical protein